MSMKSGPGSAGPFPRMHSPEVLEVLRRLVQAHDKRMLKGQPEYLRPTKLDEKNWPEYHQCPFLSTRSAWEAEIEELGGRGVLKVSPAGRDTVMKVEVGDLSTLRRLTGTPEPQLPYRREWEAAVREAFAGREPAVIEAVARLELSIPGKPAKEVATRLSSLDQYTGKGLSIREVSARLFWGMSKVLDCRQQLIASVLDSDDCPFPCSPVVLNVKLSSRGTSVMFIENLDTFEKVTRRDPPFHVVYASGFRASAKRVRTREGSTVFFHAESDFSQAPSFLAWLYKEAPEIDCFLWGDLDFAGMSILRASREAFPRMTAWRAGYELMMDAAVRGVAHSLEMAGKSGQQVIDLVGCEYSDERVITFLKQYNHFVDQEAVDPSVVLQSLEN